MDEMFAFKYSAGGAARSMPTYDDGSCNTLTADWHSPAVAYAVRMREGCRGGCKGPLVQENVSGTLATGNDQTIFEGGYVVRRLTPTECGA